MKNQKAFTLIELLVAMGIYVVVITLVSVALTNMLHTTDASIRNIMEFNKVQRTIIDMQRDFIQAASRPILDENNSYEPALQSPNVNNKNTLVFSTRIVSDNTINRNLLNIRRVGYRLHDGKLYRVTWPVLDRMNFVHDEKEILDNVDSISWEYFDKSKIAYPLWPPMPDRSDELPAGIKLELSLKQGGVVSKIFLLAEQ